MLRSIKIEGYRALKSLKLDALTPVNLIVGRNNAGKTSILDAVELLVRGGEPLALLLSAQRRREQVFEEEQLGQPIMGHIGSISWDMSSQFFGRLANEAAHEIRLSSEVNDADAVVLKCSVLGGRALDEDISYDEWNDCYISIKSSTGLDIRYKLRDGAIFDSERLSRPRRGALSGAPCVYVSSRRLEPAELRPLWESVVLTPDEQLVVEALQLVEPALERVAFLGGRRGDGLIFASLAGSGQRIPLGSMGEGMYHLLALAIMLVNAKGGYMMIDEIDTGLHYSVMERVWRFLIVTAKRLNVQIFATTHSDDCLRALGGLYDAEPELASAVSLHRVERGAEQATRYSAQEVALAAARGIELRGHML